MTKVESNTTLSTVLHTQAGTNIIFELKKKKFLFDYNTLNYLKVKFCV
jgi:hypothetical protein